MKLLVLCGSYKDFERFCRDHFPALSHNTIAERFFHGVYDEHRANQMLSMQRNMPYVVDPSFYNLPPQTRRFLHEHLINRHCVPMALTTDVNA